MSAFRKRLTAVLMLCVLLFAVAACAGRNRAAYAPAGLESAAARHRRFLAQCGWLVSDSAPAVIAKELPGPDSPVFSVYNALQKKQGFDLTPYAGRRVLCFTYEVLANAAGEPLTGVYAHVLESGNRMIGGDVSSVSSDGFMLGFNGERNENDTFG